MIKGLVRLSRSSLVNSGWIALRYLTISLSGLVITWAFAHYSSKEILGQYQFVISLLAIFSIFTLPGLNMAAIKAVANGQLAAVSQAVRRSFLASLLAVPMIIGYGLWQYGGSPNLGLAVIIGGLLFPFYYAPNTWYVFYEGQAIFLPVTIRTTLAALVSALSLIYGLWLHLGVVELVAIFLGLNSLLTGLFYWETVVRLRRLPRSGSTANQLDVSYGLSVTGQKFIFTLTDSLPPLVITFLLGSIAVANYQIAVVFFAAMSGFVGALAAIYLPSLFNGRANASGLMRRNWLVGATCLPIYYLAVRLVFLRLYGPIYHDSYLVAMALTPLLLTSSLKTYLLSYLTAKEQNRQVVASYLVANLIGLLTLWLTAQQSFTFSVTSYLYLLNLSLLLGLGYFYRRQVSEQQH